MAWAWNQHAMKPGQKLVLLALADHADDDGKCWPGIDRLAAKCECGRRKIIYTLAEFERMGLLRKESRTRHGAGSGRGRESNCYYLDVNNQCAKSAHRSATNVQKRDDQCAKTCTTYKEVEPSVEPSVLPPLPPAPKFAYLPDWVPADAWALFLQSRQAVRASVAAWQIPLLLKRLDKLRRAGNDPGAVIEQSVRSGYRDFFEVKRHAAHQQRSESARDHHARISAIIDRNAAEAAAALGMGADAVCQAQGDLRHGVVTPFRGRAGH